MDPKALHLQQLYVGTLRYNLARALENQNPGYEFRVGVIPLAELARMKVKEFPGFTQVAEYKSVFRDTPTRYGVYARARAVVN